MKVGHCGRNPSLLTVKMETLERHPRRGWRQDDGDWNCGAVGDGEADDGGDGDLGLDWVFWT
jgi:hypothetical protein